MLWVSRWVESLGGRRWGRGRVGLGGARAHNYTAEVHTQHKHEISMLTGICVGYRADIVQEPIEGREMRKKNRLSEQSF